MGNSKDEATEASIRHIRHLEGWCREMDKSRKNSNSGGIPHFNVDAPVPKTKPAADPSNYPNHIPSKEDIAKLCKDGVYTIGSSEQPSSQVDLPDGSDSFEFRLNDAPEPLLELRDDGKIFWMGREVTTDEELVSGMRDVLRSSGSDIPIAPPFADCRRYMANTLKCDEGLRISYEANVAMLLQDTYDITLPAKRNQMAKDILRLIFES